MNPKLKPLLMGNWKLNHTRASAKEFFDRLLPELNALSNCELAIAPVAPMLEFVGRLIEHSPLKLGAQNVFYSASGAYTGEWSAANLAELDVKLCIVGHSERRTLFHESDDMVAQKTRALLACNITPVCCVGETLKEREEELTLQVLGRQVEAIAKGLDLREQDLVFAYEPVWAIGTGKSASKEQAQEAHNFIRQKLHAILGENACKRLRILYGGSVTPENLKEFMRMPDIDGALVGGASLHAQSFLSMVKEL